MKYKICYFKSKGWADGYINFTHTAMNRKFKRDSQFQIYNLSQSRFLLKNFYQYHVYILDDNEAQGKIVVNE